MKPACNFLMCVFTLAYSIAVPAAETFTVLKSDVPMYKKGQKLRADARINLPDTLRLQVKTPKGETCLLRGPHDKSLEKCLAPTVSDRLARSVKLGRAGGDAAPLWSINVENGQNRLCVKDNTRISFWRDVKAQPENMRFNLRTMQTDTAPVTLDWQANKEMLDWPGILKVVMQQEYFYQLNDNNENLLIIYRLPEVVSDTDETLHQRFLDAGCNLQAARWVRDFSGSAADSIATVE